MTFGSIENLRLDLGLHSDILNRVVLSFRGQSFTLGPRTNPVDPSGRPEIDFVPEPGDELTFSAARSALAWPTPFEFNIMIPHSPWWKRYIYYRLLWKKHSGALTVQQGAGIANSGSDAKAVACRPAWSP